MRDSLQFGLDNNGTGQIKLPVDFAADDGAPGDTVYAKAIFTPKPVFDPKLADNKSRLVLADWITSEDNPRFTTMIANRIWKHVFGAALIEPIDTMMDDTLPGNSTRWDLSTRHAPGTLCVPRLQHALWGFSTRWDLSTRQGTRCSLSTRWGFSTHWGFSTRWDFSTRSQQESMIKGAVESSTRR